MKFAGKILVLLLVAALVLIPTQAVHAKGLLDGQVVFGNTYTLKSGETLNGDLAVFGGAATIEEGATVRGSIVLFGGSLTIDGEVTKDVVVFGGAATLGAKSIVNGDLVTMGVTLSRAEGSVVRGKVINNGNGPMIDTDQTTPVTPTEPDVTSPIRDALDPFFQIGRAFVNAILLGLLAMLLMLFLADPTHRVAQAISAQPVMTAGFGLLTVVLYPAALVLLTLTIILIPVALVSVPLLVVAIIFGWLALGLEIGIRLTRAVNVTWPMPLTAGFGTFLVTVVANLVGLIWCVGWILPFILGVMALGGVLMTRFGTRVVLPPMPPAAPVPPAPPAEPIPPAS